MTDQVMLPPWWNSFVGTGIHNGPVPPASRSFTSFETVHTHAMLHMQYHQEGDASGYVAIVASTSFRLICSAVALASEISHSTSRPFAIK